MLLITAILLHLTIGTKCGVNYCLGLFNDCGAIGTMWDISERYLFRSRRANENPIPVAILTDHQLVAPVFDILSSLR